MKQSMEYTGGNEETVPGVSVTKTGWVCNRCLNRNRSEFARDELGVYCRRCLNFGKSSTYNHIHRQKAAVMDQKEYGLSKVIYLSEMQRLASLKCVDAYQQNYDVLIFAVCGAGKTEIVYDVMLKALNDRKVVCFATPRKDVVLELFPRFKRDFQNVTIVSLYGGSPDKGMSGNLYVTTTHQLINFYQFFDLIILDEVDAFPYYNNRMLEGFVMKAKKSSAPIILLTATPTKSLKTKMKSGALQYFVIPARYHRHPIPVPKVRLTKNTAETIRKGRIPKKVQRWLLQKKHEGKQVFVFVPDIETGKALEVIMKPEFSSRFVCSESPDRKEIVNSFRKNELQFIITTTILERGVTVSNVDVCIINSDDDIFDERAIVQIIGRSGRDRNFPDSDAVLFSDFYTRGIKEALKHIKSMNKTALKKGLIEP